MKIATLSGLANGCTQPRGHKRLALILHILGNNAGIPRTAHRCDPTGQQAWKNGRQNQVPPALPERKPRQPRYLPEFTRDRVAARNDVEQDVPLGSQQQQDHRTGPQPNSHCQHPTHHHREDHRCRKTCCHLDDWL